MVFTAGRFANAANLRSCCAMRKLLSRNLATPKRRSSRSLQNDCAVVLWSLPFPFHVYFRCPTLQHGITSGKHQTLPLLIY